MKSLSKSFHTQCRAHFLARSRHSWALLLLVHLLAGCGAMDRVGIPLITLSPARSTLSVGSRVFVRPVGEQPGSSCTWQSSAPAILASLGHGLFQAMAEGSATINARCGGNPTNEANVLVSTTVPHPLIITKGGTYSGTWSSNDPSVPAISIATDEPVTLRNSVVSGRGDLIDINGQGTGANVIIEYVTGTALDPGSAGRQRGSFVSAQGVSSLKVKHCSMLGVSFGVKVQSSVVSKLAISKNLGSELEDRASDGAGGFATARPNLGHFIFLYEVSAPNGADIGWNQMINTIGASSTEDVINIYKSQGTAAAPIRVHDNYMEGYSSITTPSYTGAGLITDGDSTSPVTAFVNFEANTIVHTAGSGVEIASGHDIIAAGNHVVSCGIDAQGKWFAMPFVNAAILWNYYGAPDFYNNVIRNTQGGMLRPATDNTPAVADFWARVSDLDATDVYLQNAFSDPCLVNGQTSTQAEDAERAGWAAKLAAAGIVPGDQKAPQLP